MNSGRLQYHAVIYAVLIAFLEFIGQVGFVYEDGTGWIGEGCSIVHAASPFWSIAMV